MNMAGHPAKQAGCPACFFLTPPVSGKRKLPKGPCFSVGGQALWQRGFLLSYHGLPVAESARPLRIVYLAHEAARLLLGRFGGGWGTIAFIVVILTYD